MAGKPHTGEYSALYQMIAQLVHNARQQKGWTQGQLSVRSGVGIGAINNIENCKSATYIHTLCALAEALEVPYKELLPDNPVPTLSEQGQVIASLLQTDGLSSVDRLLLQQLLDKKE